MFRIALWILPLGLVAQPSTRGGISAITLPDPTSGRAIAVDKSGDIYVAGVAHSGFPTTIGAFQSEYRSGACPNGRYGPRPCEDIFIARLSPDGTVKAATYLGGTGEEEVTALVLDSAGNINLVGSTTSADFPVLGINAQRKLQGSRDAFYVRMQADLKRVLFSTYMGGSSVDRATSVALAGDGSVVVYGETWSDDLPMPGTALQKSAQPNDSHWFRAPDVFLARIQRQQDDKIFYATYFGGPGGVQAGALALDADGSLYITGTVGPNFPTTPGGLTSGTNGGALVAKISPDDSKLMYSAILGGNRNTRGVALAVDQNGRATVAADTNSSDMPTTADAVQRSGGGPGDLQTNAYIARLTPRGDALEYATYYGAPGFVDVQGMAVEPGGVINIVGTNVGATPAVTADAVQSCGFANLGWGYVAR
ncbi:MAG: SBBP repeat-containing protein, partial [Saprospiraceae bacterium]